MVDRGPEVDHNAPMNLIPETTIDGRLIIDGKRLEGEGLLISKSPTTLEPIGEVHLAQAVRCDEAISAAERAFPLWRETPNRQKQRILRSARQILLRRADEAAHLLSREKGSPLMESMGVEILGSLGILDYYSRHESPALRSKRVAAHGPLLASKRNAFHFPPLGPTLVISPWNFPFLIPLSDTISALTAGNTVVLRPSTATPLVALLLGEIFLEAGLPPGVLNIVVSRTAQAEEMIVDPRIQTIMFTGSVSVGKRIMELAARNLTNIVLELGGKDPMIVLKDADVERAARGAVWTAFMNCGQSCASIERAYIAREIAPAFIDRIVALTRGLRVGDPLDPETDIGPMTTLGQLESVLGHLEDARTRGAEFLTGGGRIEGRLGYFLPPTVLTRVDHTMKVMTEETFGPVLPIMAVADEDEAIARANDSEYGLTASVWTRDRRAAARIAQRLEAGTVTVNDHMYSFTEPTAIWGGIKKTGAGRSHGPYGLLHLVNQKYISSDFRRTKQQLWWFPYGSAKTKAIGKSLTLLFGTGIRRKLKTLFAMRPAWGLLIRTVSPRSLFRIARRLFG